MRIVLSFSLFLLPLAFWSCGSSDDTVTGNDHDLVPVQINLVMGFGQKDVRLKVDGATIYQAYPSGYSSYSGPQASFSTYMERDSQYLTVWWRNTGGGDAKQDSVRLDLHKVSRYYLYFSLTLSDTLLVEGQESPINYLKTAG